MKWIRWWGVIAFALFVAGISVFWFVLADSLVKCSIERTGTALVGAKVELDKADLTLFPLGLKLSGLQVTNPEAPMTNAVSAVSVTMLMDGVNIFRRKVIIEEMAVEGVRLNTPRKTSGAISRRLESASRKGMLDRFALPALEMPDVRKILAGEELESVNLLNRTRDEITQAYSGFEGELKLLADKKKLDEYRARFERIKGSGKDGVGGILGATGEFLSLQKDIKAELERIDRVKAGVGGVLASYREKIDEAKRAPFRDIERIKRKYGLTPEGFANILRALLGPTVASRIDTALLWYGRLSPVVARAAMLRDGGVKVERPIRGSGVNVRFPEKRPVPDFLIRKAALSVWIPAGDFSGLVTNITDDQEVLGSPMGFNFSGTRLKGLESLKLTGEINRTTPAKPKDTVAMKMRGYRIEGVELASKSAFPMELRRALLDIDLTARIEGAAMDAGLSAGLSSVEMASVKQGMGAIERAVASALSGVKGFKLKASATGTLSDYDLKLSSDLDVVLKGAVGKIVADLSAEFAKSLRAGVLERTKKPLEELSGSFAGLESIERELGARSGLTDKLLDEIGEASMGGIKLPKLPF